MMRKIEEGCQKHNNQGNGLVPPIVVGINVIGARCVRWSVDWEDGVVIHQVFGGWEIIVGVMVGFVRVIWLILSVVSIVVGVKQGGGWGVGWSVQLVGSCLEGG